MAQKESITESFQIDLPGDKTVECTYTFDNQVGVLISKSCVVKNQAGEEIDPENYTLNIFTQPSPQAIVKHPDGTQSLPLDSKDHEHIISLFSKSLNLVPPKTNK